MAQTAHQLANVLQQLMILLQKLLRLFLNTMYTSATGCNNHTPSKDKKLAMDETAGRLLTRGKIYFLKVEHPKFEPR